jgi:hypothetical protein
LRIDKVFVGFRPEAPIAMLRFAESVEKTLGSITLKQKLKVFSGLAASIEEPVAHRCDDISRRLRSHETIASR